MPAGRANDLTLDLADADTNRDDRPPYDVGSPCVNGVVGDAGGGSFPPRRAAGTRRFGERPSRRRQRPPTGERHRTSERGERSQGPYGDPWLIGIELAVMATIALPTLSLLSWDNPPGQRLRWLIYSAATTAILLLTLAVFLARRRSHAAAFQAVLLAANSIFTLGSHIPLQQ